MPPAASLTDATVIRIGQLVGASQVIVGTLRLDGEVLVAEARTIALDVGRVLQVATERGPVADLFATFDRLARRLAPASPPTLVAARAAPPLAAFESYVKGLLAETPATAVSYLNSALQASVTFVRPRLALWEVYTAQGDHDRALAAVQPVPADSRWGRRARFLAGLSQLSSKRHDEAFATFRALADERPSAAVLNNLGVVQMRRAVTPEAGLPTYYFNRAAEADPAGADYHFNLGYAYWRDRDMQAAIYWLREAVRRNPADGDAHFVLGAALAAAGQGAEATREKELARRLSSTYEEWEKGGAEVPPDLERVKSDVELPAGRVDETLASAGQRDQQDLARFYLDRGRRLYEQENDRDAMAELSRALFLAPYQAEAHLLIARIHLRAGRTADAVDALKISLWSEESAEAHAVLGSAYLELRDLESARAEAERALALDPASSEARHVLERATGADPR